jgi:hypothetical protein
MKETISVTKSAKDCIPAAIKVTVLVAIPTVNFKIISIVLPIRLDIIALNTGFINYYLFYIKLQHDP